MVKEENKIHLGDASADFYTLPNPDRLNSFLPSATPYTTPSISANTPTKLLLPTTVKTVKNFELDGVNLRYFLNNPTAVNKEFAIEMTSSVQTGANNTIVTFQLYKNGVLEEGVGIQRKVSTGADVGALSISGTVLLSHNDYVELYVTTTLSSTVTFIKTSISINEKLGAS